MPNSRPRSRLAALIATVCAATAGLVPAAQATDRAETPSPATTAARAMDRTEQAATGIADRLTPSAPTAGGRVCLFHAPNGAYGAGHAGWAVMDGSGRWFSGATETKASKGFAGNWLRGPEDVNSMLGNFKAQRINKYTEFRCKNTSSGSPTGAVTRFKLLMNTEYNWLGNNCLTRSVLTFKAYSSAMNSLKSGVSIPPKWYFNIYLGYAGWESSVRL
ncbi:hypothetical protein ACIRU3_36870 [Streptomyces sp. NPDC101151]|uniref:hypothetical protein n=1 Tax=Streptomyces sp. NPDC101151 TaxID=3366115 RepID=UPI0038254AFA